MDGMILVMAAGTGLFLLGAALLIVAVASALRARADA